MKPKSSKSLMGEIFRYTGKMRLSTRDAGKRGGFGHHIEIKMKKKTPYQAQGILSIPRRLVPDSPPSSAKTFNTSCVVREKVKKKVINQSNCVAPRHLASELKSSYWRLLKMTPEELCNYTKDLEEARARIKDGKPNSSRDVKILNPSDETDLMPIKYFNRVCRI